MKKIVYTAVLIFSISNAGIEDNIIKGYANTDDTVVEESDEKAVRITYGTAKKINDEAIKVEKKKVIPPPDYTEANILLYKEDMDSELNKFNLTKGINGNFVNNDVIQKDIDNNNASTIRDNEYLNLSMHGHCIIKNDITVSSKAVAKIPCKTAKGRYIDIVVNLVPEDKAYALNADILSFIDRKGEMYMVNPEKSFISHHSGGTANVATEVNTHQVDRNLALFAQGLSEGVENAGNLAVNQLRQSMTSEEIAVVNSGLTNQIIKTRNTRRPTKDDLEDYGVIGAVTGLMKGLGNVVRDMTQNQDKWTYKIRKNTILNFNLMY